MRRRIGNTKTYKKGDQVLLTLDVLTTVPGVALAKGTTVKVLAEVKHGWNVFIVIVGEGNKVALVPEFAVDKVGRK